MGEDFAQGCVDQGWGQKKAARGEGGLTVAQPPELCGGPNNHLLLDSVFIGCPVLNTRERLRLSGHTCWRVGGGNGRWPCRRLQEAEPRGWSSSSQKSLYHRDYLGRCPKPQC